MTWFPYAMIAFAIVVVTICSWIFMVSNRITDVRVWLALGLTDTFIISCIGSLALIVGLANGQCTCRKTLPNG